MEGRRKLKATEVLALAEQLEQAGESLAKTYNYPLSDFVACMHATAESGRHEVLEAAGQAKTFFLYFRSPDYTWKMLCGREGIYSVSAETLKAEGYEMISMN